MKQIPIIMIVMLSLWTPSGFAAGQVSTIVNGQPSQNDVTPGSIASGDVTTGALLRSELQGGTFPSPSPTFDGICSGTLVGCRSFLTAAHCVCEGFDNPFGFNAEFPCAQIDPARLRVYLQNGGIYQVSAIKVNPSFTKFGDNGPQGSDNAVLTLSKPVLGLPPAKLNETATPADPDSNPLTGRIVGFGVTAGPTGAQRNYGIKRFGKVETASCVGGAGVPEPQYLCWNFTEPLGDEGEDSNVCFGDSGGPLFIDGDIGPVVAGVNSGILNHDPLCSADTSSFASNVFASKSFIKKAIVTTVDEFGRCRIEVRKRVRKYTNSVYNAQKQCINAALSGKINLGECIVNKAAPKISKAAAAIKVSSLSKRCPDEIIDNSLLGGGCSDAHTTEELKACIVDTGNQIAAQMLDAEYALDGDPALTAKEDKPLLKCQRAIGNAGKSFLFKNLAAQTKCEVKIDSNKTAECPEFDTTTGYGKLASSLGKKITKACPDPTIATLNGKNPFSPACAGTVGNVADFIACQLDAHSAMADSLNSLALGRPSSFNQEACGPVSQVGDPEPETFLINEGRLDGKAVNGKLLHTFRVEAGIKLLRVTVNGEEFSSGMESNDLKLSLKPPVGPSIPNIPANIGRVIEAVQVSNPAEGEWNALVEEPESEAVSGRPYQLTITMLKAKTDE